MPNRTSTSSTDPSADYLFDVMPEPALELSLDGSIIQWNRAAGELYGFSVTHAGAEFLSFVAEDHRTDWCALWETLLDAGNLDRTESVHRTTAGDVIDVRVTALIQSGTVYLFVHDLTELRRSERAVRELEEQSFQRLIILAAASHVALDILSNRTGVDALKHIAESARQLTNARYAALGVRHPDGQRVSEFVTAGLTPEEEKAIGPPPSGHGVLGLLLHRFAPLRIDCLKDHPASSGFPPGHPPMVTFLGVPIRRGDMVLGSLYLTNKLTGGGFTEQDEIAVESLGAHAAVAIHNLQMLSRQRALLKGLINVQEEERRAVAYDLHDGLTQYVMAAYMHMEAFRKAYAAGKVDKAERDLKNGMRYLKEATVESRRLVNGLRSLALDDLGLSGALAQLFAEEKAHAGWTDAELAHNIAESRFDKSLETAVYRVVQEALNNVRKHADTKKVRVLLLLTPPDSRGIQYISIEVRDWGRGFVPDEKISDPAHVGLQGMSERVSLAGGVFSLTAAPGEGVTVRAKIPIA